MLLLVHIITDIFFTSCLQFVGCFIYFNFKYKMHSKGTTWQTYDFNCHEFEINHN